MIRNQRSVKFEDVVVWSVCCCPQARFRIGIPECLIPCIWEAHGNVDRKPYGDQCKKSGKETFITLIGEG